MLADLYEKEQGSDMKLLRQLLLDAQTERTPSNLCKAKTCQIRPGEFRVMKRHISQPQILNELIEQLHTLLVTMLLQLFSDKKRVTLKSPTHHL
ncbi:hypothetical protein L484_026834 [Morus notabilis]|uniref:Uncharacterized protein n=1 Tax=Morus notabilis TaxID=981085 RepID=W9RGJ7_9ROSA|nr:hypothetical protein L484_026834 [Morus notabilis]